MKKNKKPFLDQVAEFNPQIADICEEIKRERATDVIRDSPRNYLDSGDWREAWLYSFQRGSLNPGDHMLVSDEAVKCVVWAGHQFNDRLTAPLERISEKLGPDNDLNELRLIGTRVSQEGIARLQRVAPHARIMPYTEKAAEERPALSYADPLKAKSMFP